jgi:hypothetical protein
VLFWLLSPKLASGVEEGSRAFPDTHPLQGAQRMGHRVCGFV